MALPILVGFFGGLTGEWRIDRMENVTGEGLPVAARLAVVEGAGLSGPPAHDWVLRGTTSNMRYTNRTEADELAVRQEGLKRPQATRAALIPIRKSEAWWALAQDERRAIFEEQGRHIGIGMEYLPQIARRLHHCRDLGRDLGRDQAEAFDFLTWFEYAPEDSERFEDMVRRLRGTPEWGYVDREVDIRLAWDR